MDNSDILYNRVKSFSVSVPKNFDIKKDKHILQESVQNSLKYLYNTLLDKYYLKTFKYKMDKYYPVSNTPSFSKTTKPILKSVVVLTSALLHVIS